MEGKNKIFTYIYIYFLSIFTFVIWLLSTLKNKAILNINFDIESISLLALAIITFLVLIFIKDSFYLSIPLCYAPFAFSKSFDITIMPKILYVIACIAILGLVLHLIIYHRSINKGTYFFGLIVFVIGMLLGGVINSKYFLNSFIASLAIGLLIVLVYIYIVTYLEKHSFSEIAHIMTSLAILLVLQTIACQILNNKDEMFMQKLAEYGWGCSNNLALMLLFTFPFTAYLALNSKGPLTLASVMFVFIQALAILLNYSRGSIFIMIVALPITLVYAFIKSKSKLWIAFCYLLVIFLLFIFFVIIAFTKKDLLEAIIKNAFNFNFSFLNGRDIVYEVYLNGCKENIFFGKGIISPIYIEGLNFGPDDMANQYTWGHNTFIHTLYISGIFGVICLCYHLFNKYNALLKHPNSKTIIVSFAFLFSGLYGMMDVSYYYVIYMIPMIIIMALVEYEINPNIEDDGTL